MRRIAILCAVLVALVLTAGPGRAEDKAGEQQHGIGAASQPINFDRLRLKITGGQATLAEVRQALTDADIGRLTNTLHGLYSMRWHRGVNHLLIDMWRQDRDKYPELNWEAITEAPARIALASTLARIYYEDNSEYLDYIRSHEQDEHEFHRAQVVVALGFNGNPGDVPYLKAMADGDNHYVAQSAITGLSLMDRKAASDALIELWHKHRGTPRGNLILEVLRQAYNLVPTTKKPATAGNGS